MRWCKNPSTKKSKLVHDDSAKSAEKVCQQASSDKYRIEFGILFNTRCLICCNQLSLIAKFAENTLFFQHKNISWPAVKNTTDLNRFKFWYTEIFFDPLKHEIINVPKTIFDPLAEINSEFNPEISSIFRRVDQI